MVWKGGLASHGAAIALVVAMWIYSKKVTNKSTMWSLDKLVIAVALAAVLPTVAAVIIPFGFDDPSPVVKAAFVALAIR